MDAKASWRRYQELRCEVPSVRLAVDASRMGLDAGSLARAEPAARAGARRDGGARGRRDREPGRGADGGPLLAARARARADAGDPRRRSRASRARFESSRPTCTPGRCGRRAAARFRNLLCVGIGGSALGPELVADALGDRRRDRMRLYFLDNTDPGRHRPRARRRSATSSPRRCVVVIEQERRHAGDPQRDARGASAAYRAAGLDFGQHAVAVTRRGQRARPARAAEERLARALPDVGLGRRAHQRALARWASCPRRCRGSTSTAMLAGRARPWTRRRARGTRDEPGARCWRSPGTTRPAAGAARRTWWSCRTRTGCVLF